MGTIVLFFEHIFNDTVILTKKEGGRKMRKIIFLLVLLFSLYSEDTISPMGDIEKGVDNIEIMSIDENEM